MSEEHDHKPKIKVYKLPKVRMTRAAWDRLFAFSKIAGDRSSECIGVLLGTANPRDKDFVVEDVLLGFAKQANTAYTQMDWPNTWKEMTEEQKKRVIGWWHSHHYMDHFHSGTDEATHRREYLQYSDNTCLTMTVSLKTESVLCRVDTDWASWDDLEVSILEPVKTENKELDKVLTDLDDLAKKMSELDKKATELREAKAKELLTALTPEVDKKVPKTVYSYDNTNYRGHYWDRQNPTVLGTSTSGTNHDYQSASKLSDTYMEKLTREIALLEDRRAKIKKKGKLKAVISQLDDLYGEMADILAITHSDPIWKMKESLGIGGHEVGCMCELCLSLWSSYPNWKDTVFKDKQTRLKELAEQRDMKVVNVPKAAPPSQPVDQKAVVQSINAGDWRPPTRTISVGKIGGRDSAYAPTIAKW
jgi:hypothetical protein